MTKNKTDRKKWRWYHGVLLYATIQAATFGLETLARKTQNNPRGFDENTKEFYNSQKLPAFAPPDWAFAPAWAVNNALCIYGLLRVLNLPPETDGRGEFLTLQTLSWIDFALFPAASFGLRSNAHSAVLTNLYLLLTLASLYVAFAKLKDQKTSLSLSTLTVWLAVAAPLSATILAWNGDEFYNIEPPARVSQTRAAL